MSGLSTRSTTSPPRPTCNCWAVSKENSGKRSIPPRFTQPVLPGLLVTLSRAPHENRTVPTHPRPNALAVFDHLQLPDTSIFRPSISQTGLPVTLLRVESRTACLPDSYRITVLAAQDPPGSRRLSEHKANRSGEKGSLQRCKLCRGTDWDGPKTKLVQRCD